MGNELWNAKRLIVQERPSWTSIPDDVTAT
jgi:hypothetical protein